MGKGVQSSGSRAVRVSKQVATQAGQGPKQRPNHQKLYFPGRVPVAGLLGQGYAMPFEFAPARVVSVRFMRRSEHNISRAAARAGQSFL